MTLADQVEADLAPLYVAMTTAEWQNALEATPAHEAEVVAASKAFDAVLADRNRFASLKAADDGSDRRVHLLRLAFEASQRERSLADRIIEAEAELATIFSTHRGEIGGKPVPDNEIDRILRESTDTEERRAAWDAAKSIGPIVDSKLRELARLRNQAAQKLGYRDHFAMALALDEIDETWLFALLDSLDAQLAASWAAHKTSIDRAQRVKLGLREGVPLQPWDYDDAFFQESPAPAVDSLEAALAGVDPVAAATAYVTALGHDVRGVLEASDLYERDRKNQHAFCMDMNRGGDVRVLANCTPGLRWLGTMVHELGHAIYDLSISSDLPWALRTTAHTMTTEAIAMIHGRVVRDGDFLERFCGANRSLGDLTLLRSDLQIFAHWVPVMTRFEQAMYADPDQDLGALWWSLVERNQGVTPPDGPRPHDWGCKVHFAIAPVYYHNYLLGELIASQLEALIERETGSRSAAANPERAGALLRERFQAPGATLRWDALVEQATGAPLSPDAFTAFVNG